MDEGDGNWSLLCGIGGKHKRYTSKEVDKSKANSSMIKASEEA